jgi:aryl-alcohol dehydrogenase-like predicted oxidoreductase
VQSEYSLWSRDIEQEVRPVLSELGIGLVAYSPLGRGFLTGQITSTDSLAPNDFRRSNPRFQGANLESNLTLLHNVQAIADEKECAPGQLALAWVLAQGDDVVPIPGTKRRTYLQQNAEAAELELSAEDLAALEEAAPIGVAAGDRYPDMTSIGR